MSAPTGGWEEARWRDVREAVEQHRNQRELSEILAELADEEMLESAADLEAVQCSIARIDELAERERAVAEREQRVKQREQLMHKCSELQKRVAQRLREQVSIRMALHSDQPGTVRRAHAASTCVAEYADHIQEGVRRWAHALADLQSRISEGQSAASQAACMHVGERGHADESTHCSTTLHGAMKR